MNRYVNLTGQEIDSFFNSLEIQCSYFHMVEEMDEWIGYMHCHKEHELAYILSGEGDYFMDGGQISLAAGDLIITPPLIDHMEKGDPDTPFSIIFVHVRNSGNELSKLDALFHNSVQKVSLKEKRSRSIFLNLSYEVYMQQTGYYAMMQQYLKELYVLLYRSLNEENEPIQEMSGRKYQRRQAIEIVKQIRQYTKIHLSEKVNIQEMSEHFFYHPKYLNSVVKKQTGETLSNYVMSVKIEEACKLLKSEELTIADIVEMTGFSSVPYFYRCFGERMEITPNQYRICHHLAEEQAYHE